MLDVFLIPLGGDRYQPYCEPPDAAPEAEDAEKQPGIVRRLIVRFKAVLAEAEVERRRAARGELTPPAPTRMGRLRDRIMRFVAEHIAEQRLLWHLRHQDAAVLFHPEDLAGARALERMRAELRRDKDRHLIWLVVYTILFVASGALVLLPGPNVAAYFVGFFVIAHYLSWRGARHGLTNVEWRTEASAPLAELRGALGLDEPGRDSTIRDIAARLHLEDLPIFVKSMAQDRA